MRTTRAADGPPPAGRGRAGIPPPVRMPAAKATGAREACIASTRTWRRCVRQERRKALPQAGRDRRRTAAQGVPTAKDAGARRAASVTTWTWRCEAAGSSGRPSLQLGEAITVPLISQCRCQCHLKRQAMLRDPPLSPSALLMQPSIQPSSTSSSLSPNAAGDPTRSPVVTVGAVASTINSAVVIVVVIVARRGR